RHLGRAAQRAQVADPAGAAGAQPPQPGDPHPGRDRRRGAARHGRGGALRPGAADDAPAAAPGRHRAAQPGVRRPARLRHAGRAPGGGREGGRVSIEEIRTGLFEAGRIAKGRAKAEFLESLAARAKAESDRDLEAAVLLALVQAYEYGGERDRMPIAFARLLKIYDEFPAELARHTYS